MSLADRLQQVLDRIQRGAERARRDPATIRLIAVTKVFPASVVHDAWALGLREFGENYVQEFERKSPEVARLDGARFHLLGHLQSNKARKAAELFDGIDAVDSEKLARRLQDGAAEIGKVLPVMIEVKLSEEDSKHGAPPEAIGELAAAIGECRSLRLRGLLTMPPWSEDAGTARPYFRRLRELAEQHGLGELSMGMSHDLEVAIEEGSTEVRVGTALFGQRVRPPA